MTTMSCKRSLRDLSEAAGLIAQCFASAEEFIASGLHCQAACLITDILMPKMSGLELQARLKDEECDIPIIFITAHGNATMPIQAIRGGWPPSSRNRSVINCCLLLPALPLICEQPIMAIACDSSKGAFCGNSYVPCRGPSRP